jgi:hypothetical protein
MYTPDLIQRIYFEKAKGNDLNFQKVFTDLRAHDFGFTFHFDFEGRKIFWTCFESKKYNDIIQEADEYIYFYLWDTGLEFEIIISGHTYKEELDKNILERTPFFHSIWVIGEYFPGLDKLGDRPVKINLQHIRRLDYGAIQKLSFWLKKMLTQYSNLKKPIFERVDYPKVDNGEKRWKKIADKKGE